MIATDESALMCDLAETYSIYDYKSLPLSKVATFAVGLRENSRIKMKMNDIQYPLNTLLLASAVDRLALLVWMNSKDGAKGLNKPKAVLDQLITKVSDSDIESFDSPEEFERRRKEILEEGGQ